MLNVLMGGDSSRRLDVDKASYFKDAAIENDANQDGGVKNRPHIPGCRKGIRVQLAALRGPLQYFRALESQEGAYAWLDLRGKLILMLNDATGIDHVLQQNPANYWKGDVNKVLAPLLADGIFLSEGSRWRRQRQETTPGFTTQRLGETFEIMAATIEEMFDGWERQARAGEPIDVGVEMTRLTLDLFLRALFHVDAGDIARDIRHSLGLFLREAEGRIWSPFNLPQKWVLALPKYQRAMQMMHGTVDRIIAGRKADHAFPDDLLSRLIDSYGEDAGEQHLLRQQILSFMLAGHETTAHGLTWSLFHLAQEPEWQERLCAEGNGLTGMDWDQLRNLVGSQNLFSEALRLYPPVWTFSREAYQDDLIPLDDGSFVPLPARAVAMLCTYVVHRRAKYWPDPDRFDPDRFRPEIAETRPRMAWFPFGGGVRLCLGQRFATIESSMALAMACRRFKMELVPGQAIKPEPIITLRPSGPVLLKLTPRQ